VECGRHLTDSRWPVGRIDRCGTELCRLAGALELAWPDPSPATCDATVLIDGHRLLAETDSVRTSDDAVSGRTRAGERGSLSSSGEDIPDPPDQDDDRFGSHTPEGVASVALSTTMPWPTLSESAKSWPRRPRLAPFPRPRAVHALPELARCADSAMSPWSDLSAVLPSHALERSQAHRRGSSGRPIPGARPRETRSFVWPGAVGWPRASVDREAA
jgi:hypothetical protein